MLILLLLFTVSSQYPKYVGVQYNLELGIAKPTVTKVIEMEQLIMRLFKQKGGTARTWVSLTGKMGSMSKQINLGSLHQCQIQKLLQEKWNQKEEIWEDFVPMEKETKLKLKWCLKREHT